MNKGTANQEGQSFVEKKRKKIWFSESQDIVVNEEFYLCRGRVGEKCRGTRPTQLAQSFGAEVVIFWRGEEAVSEVIPSKTEGMGGVGWSSESWRECKQE